MTPLHSFTAFVAVFPNAIPTAAYLNDRASLFPSPTYAIVASFILFNNVKYYYF